MFPLAGDTFPESSDQLAAGIQTALADVLTLPPGGGVAATGGIFPAVERLTVNLNSATVRVTEPPPRPEPATSRRPGVTVGQLDVLGHPLRYDKSKLDLEVSARGVRLDFAKDARGKPLLVLAGAADGRAEAKITRADLEALALAVAAPAAKAQGVTIQELSVNLTAEGGRAVAAEVRVKAKKIMMSGVVTVRGRLAIDDGLTATASSLACTGEGMIGTMAAGLVQGKLREFEGRRFPLTALSLGDVVLRDVRVDTADGIRVTAEFGDRGGGA